MSHATDGKLPPVVGIDLGTTFSVIAHLDSYGQPRTILNSDGDATLPSAVLFDTESVVVGNEALQEAVIDPDRVARFAKRDMGKPHYSRKVAGRDDWRPEMIQSFILKRLRTDAELVIGPFTQAVITVPAYFDDPRRRATEEAGQLADLDVIDIINEPTAAAIAYRHECGIDLFEDRSELVLVYDLGGGTFDVSLVQISKGRLEMLATDGRVVLGGIDWDKRIIDHVADLFAKEHRGIDPREEPAALQQLYQRAEEAKRKLTKLSEAKIVLERPATFRTTLSVAKFEELTADLLEQTVHCVETVLKAAKKSWDDIDTVLLVGGSTIMPQVGRRLKELTGKEPTRSISPHEAVAHGAALYAVAKQQQLAGKAPDLIVDNVNAHPLGIPTVINRKTGEKRLSVLIPANQRLPCQGQRRFKTSNTGRTLTLDVFEGGDARCTRGKIGTCRIKMPDAVPAGTGIEITFHYQSNGRLKIFAQLDGQDRRWETELTRN